MTCRVYTYEPQGSGDENTLHIVMTIVKKDEKEKYCDQTGKYPYIYLPVCPVIANKASL